MLTRAIAKNVGHPPRKVRRVTAAIRGRRVSEAHEDAARLIRA